MYKKLDNLSLSAVYFINNTEKNLFKGAQYDILPLQKMPHGPFSAADICRYPNLNTY